MRKTCTNFSPPGFTGRWQDWHRGHGCDRDDGRPRTPEGEAEIAGIMGDGINRSDLKCRGCGFIHEACICP